MSTFAAVDLEESSVRQASTAVMLCTAAFTTHVAHDVAVLLHAAVPCPCLLSNAAPSDVYLNTLQKRKCCFWMIMGVLQVIGAAIQCSLAVPQHPWSAEYVVESVLSELTAPSITTTNNSRSSSSSNDGNDHASVNATQPSQPVSSRGKAGRAAAAAAEPAGFADTPSSSVRLLPEVAALIEDYTAAAAAAAATEAPLTGKINGVAVGGSTRRSRSHSSASSRAAADSHDPTAVQVEQLQAMFSQLLYEEYQQVIWGDSRLLLSISMHDMAVPSS
jgi:hypothetical protein